jgi:hypothetical protein
MPPFQNVFRSGERNGRGKVNGCGKKYGDTRNRYPKNEIR